MDRLTVDETAIRLVAVTDSEGHAHPMNTLGDLLRARKDQLRRRGTTVRQIAERAGLAESVVYDHLAKRKPYRQTPKEATLEALAVGFELDVETVWEKAKESTGHVAEGNPLQVLLIAQRDRRKMTDAQISQRARALGYGLSKATVSNLTSGKHANVKPDTVQALAEVLDLPARQIEEAAAQASRRITYRLPRRLEERLTPEKWDQIVQIVEGVLNVSE